MWFYHNAKSIFDSDVVLNKIATGEFPYLVNLVKLAKITFTFF